MPRNRIKNRICAVLEHAHIQDTSSGNDNHADNRGSSNEVPIDAHIRDIMNIKISDNDDEDTMNFETSDNDQEFGFNEDEFYKVRIKKDIPDTCSCWIQNSSLYRTTHAEKIQAKHDASKLLLLMNDTREDLRKSDVACYLRWWLTTAMRYNHVELVNLMLAETSLNLEAEASCHFIKPLYIAIERGDLSLVNTFLSKGASTSHIQRFGDFQYFRYFASLRVHEISDRHFHERVSAVEYACIADQPAVMRLLVSHYDSHDHPWTHDDISPKNVDFNVILPSSMNPNLIENREHPLHAIMRLATKFYGTKLCRLPDFVQLIIDANERSVHYIDLTCRTPLQYLMAQIRCLAPLNEFVARSHRRILVEVTEVLLDAGSKVNMVPFEDTSRDPLRLLLSNIHKCGCKIDWRFERLTCIQEACALRNHLQLVNDLTKVLLERGANLLRFKYYTLIPLAAANILKARHLETVAHSPECSLVYNEIMDCLSSLFRLALLAGATVLTNEHWSEFLGGNSFVESFIEIADYSLNASGSVTLIDMIVNPLSESNVSKLMDMLLSKREQAETDSTSQYSCQQIDQAVEYLKNTMPRSLKFMTRQAIIRAIPMKTRLWNTDVDLGLPPQLESYAIFREAEDCGDGGRVFSCK